VLVASEGAGGSARVQIYLVFLIGNLGMRARLVLEMTLSIVELFLFTTARQIKLFHHVELLPLLVLELRAL
jgi:hypothetical protein